MKIGRGQNPHLNHWYSVVNKKHRTDTAKTNQYRQDRINYIKARKHLQKPGGYRVIAGYGHAKKYNKAQQVATRYGQQHNRPYNPSRLQKVVSTKKFEGVDVHSTRHAPTGKFMGMKPVIDRQQKMTAKFRAQGNKFTKGTGKAPKTGGSQGQPPGKAPSIPTSKAASPRPAPTKPPSPVKSSPPSTGGNNNNKGRSR